MKVLIVGAGVLGSVYAARLMRGGNEVAVLARGARRLDLQENGLRLRPLGSAAVETFPVRAISGIDPSEPFELALVMVRQEQVASVLPVLAAAPRIPSVLFLVNGAAGPAAYVEALGRERVLLGFVGAGGHRGEDGVVDYALVEKGQRTTIGELDGRRTQRLDRIAAMFTASRLPVEVCPHMDAWLKTHVALVTPIANAIYLAGGSTAKLAADREAMRLFLAAVREGFGVLRALGIPVTPRALGLLALVPDFLIQPALRRGWSTPRAELLMARHAMTARAEMAMLTAQFEALIRSSGRPCPAFARLAEAGRSDGR